MNILIVGNGFDLSHYLPTKYDHFMDVMEAIEQKDLGKPIQNFFNNPVNTFPQIISKVLELKIAINEKNYQMEFVELFSKCRESKFIDQTKIIYDISKVKISFEKIISLQCQLKNNVWYKYFSHHVREVKTWIDFEIKINEALKIVASFITKVENKIEEFGSFDIEICFYSQIREKQIFLIREQCNLLEKLDILKSGYYIDLDNTDENGEKFTYTTEIDNGEKTDLRFYIKDKNIEDYFGYGKLKRDSLLNTLQKNLEEFIEIFNLYLELIVSPLSCTRTFSIKDESWINPSKIYSFNYTNTYKKIYKYNEVEIDFLHGSHGDNQNIVLGISDIEDESLKKIKAYGFTKYHQKLFKDTDYLFLNSFTEKIKSHKRKIENFESDFGNSDPKAKMFERQNLMEVESKLNLKISIWGHSLDVSDQDYILDLFSLNDDMDRNVQVTVYYFDSNAKFSLLNNLLAILGKNKVEQWMKNKWLVFKPNPEIEFDKKEILHLDQVS